MASKKARKVKAKPKAARKAAKPRRRVVVKRRMKGGDATPRAAAPGNHVHGAGAAAPPAAGAGASRLQRMMAASADNDAGLEVKARTAPPPEPARDTESDGPVRAGPPANAPMPGGRGRTVVLDEEDDTGGGVVVSGGRHDAGQVRHADDGMRVVAKGPAKFSQEDMEALRKAIIIKGGGLVVAGINLDELKYNEEGLVAVVAQDRATGAVLMQAWANKEALHKSLTSNEMTYWSRQRNKLWTKGEESGHTQRLVQLRVDCDKDAILAIVEQTGPACHRDTGTCFVDDRTVPVAGFLGELDRLVAGRAKDRPEGSYTTRLLEDPSLAAGKVVEEAKEVALVLKGRPNKDSLQHEAADLLYHLLVACRGKGVDLGQIVAELLQRHGKTDGKGAKRKA